MIKDFCLEDMIGVPMSKEDVRLLYEGYMDNYTAMFSIIEEGMVIAFITAMCLRAGVYELHLTRTDIMTKYAIRFHRAMLGLIEDALNTSDIHRLQMTVVCSNARNVKWAESLGFKREGTLVSFDVGVDYYMYGRV